MKKDKKQHKEQTLIGQNVSWYIFKLYGLKIEDSDEWRSFLFDDATIVSQKNITNFISECDEVWGERTKFYLNEINCSYIIVKVPNTDTGDTQYSEAKERAEECVAYLYFVYLFISRLSSAICFESEIFFYKPTFACFYSGKGSHGSSEKNTRDEHYTFVREENPLTVSRDDLHHIFYKNTLFKELFECVSNKDIGLQQIVTKSLVNFYRTSCIPHATTQLLGAITSIELLLKSEQGKYNSLTDRLCGLLGSKFYKSFTEKKSIFDVRHNIIHDGANCTHDNVFKSFYLYSFIVIAFSNLLKIFSSKKQIETYLELIYKHENENTKKQHFRNDPFSILTQWEQLKYDTRKFSIVMMQLCSFYRINPLIYEQKKDWEYNVTFVIFLYSDLSGVSRQEVIGLFSEYILPHIENPDFSFTEDIIEKERKRLEEDCKKFKEWYPSWSSDVASGLYQ